MEQTKYDVFINYSRKDYIRDDAVIRDNPITAIIKMFDKNGVSYWFDKEGIYSGEEFVMEISSAIVASKMLVFISSENSNVSEYTCGEILKAKKAKKLIIPFLIDKCDYNAKFEILLLPLNHIDYVAQPNTALPELLRTVKKEKERIEKIESDSERLKRIEKTLKEIKEKAKEYLALVGQQDYILKDLYSKNKYIGNTIKHCPVCEKEEPIQSQFCSQCGWQFPKLYGIDGGNVTLHEETQLAIARNNWDSLSNAIVLQKEIDYISCQKDDMETECDKLKLSLHEAHKECERQKIIIENLEDRNGTLERELKEAKDKQREEGKQELDQKGREVFNQKQVKELKYEWDFSEILVKSKKVSSVFERDNIEESIDIFKFQEILYNEYGILLDYEKITSFRTIGNLKNYILKRVKEDRFWKGDIK